MILYIFSVFRGGNQYQRGLIYETSPSFPICRTEDSCYHGQEIKWKILQNTTKNIPEGVNVFKPIAKSYLF